MSGAAAGPVIRRHEWLLAAIAALVALVVPLGIVSWLDDPAPELRVLDADHRLSSLIVDREARILIINTGNREAAGAFLGRIAQPWDPRPRTIVAPAGEDAAIGLWEALQRLDPTTVIVAGIPGADPLWAAIDAECTRRRIDVRYVSDRVSLTTDRLMLTVFGVPVGGTGGSGVVLRRGDISIVIALDSIPPPVASQALVFSGELSLPASTMLVTNDDTPRTPQQHEVLVDDRAVVRLVIDDDAVRVFGGVLRSPPGR